MSKPRLLDSATYLDISSKENVASTQFTDADDALIAITAMGGTGSVTVVSMNNNVINPTITSSTVSGVTSTRQVDKSYILNGTATAAGGVFILGSTYSGSIVFTLRKGTYVLRGTGTSLLGIYLYKADGTTINTSSNNLTFTLSADTDFSSISVRWFTASTVLNNVRVYPQVSFGSTLTEYEPHIENTLTIPDVTTAGYPLYLTSYKGITNVFTLSSSQPTFTAVAKSKLFADSYNKDIAIQSKALKALPSLITPTFTNSWVLDGAFGYYLNSFNELCFMGALKSGVLGSTAFTLPTGYRPIRTLRISCVSNGALGYIVINTNGTVVPQGNNTYVSFDGIHLRLDA